VRRGWHSQEATLFYTLDGTTPTVLSKRYTGPITIKTIGVVTLKAIAQHAELVRSTPA
jgi:hypothetical protein